MTRHDEVHLRDRQRRLAAILLVGAGFFDGLAGINTLNVDKYVVESRQGLLDLDLTGWSWAHEATGALMVVSGLLLFTARPWSIRLAAAAAVIGILLHLILLPFETIWAVIVIGLAVAVLRLLWLCRRRPTPADDVSSAGRPAR
ncbi:DUF7144 family membrane protein [Micromonospora eburnea]|uniref:DUF7144 domain-containing protein n=1 Tax=Micromonospora eburnea TaxID=227316 RepID=A0A1C6VQB9_9ACTN|nr:hypothetical protein [Micromonospora eburnea]SCL68509.1 hypothetical protein GA0070604_6321 [Micromonospora eburnea]